MGLDNWNALKEKLLKPVSEIEYVRARNSLISGGIMFAGQLHLHTYASILKTANFGRKALNASNEFLILSGLSKIQEYPQAPFPTPSFEVGEDYRIGFYPTDRRMADYEGSEKFSALKIRFADYLEANKEFFSKNSALVQQEPKVGQVPARKEVEDVLKTQWANATLESVAPLLAAGLSQEFRQSVLDEIDRDGVFVYDFDTLCSLVNEKFEDLLEQLLEDKGVAGEAPSPAEEEKLKTMSSQIKEIIGDGWLKRFNPEMSQRLINAIANDEDVAKMLSRGTGENNGKVLGILRVSLNLDQKSGPA